MPGKAQKEIASKKRKLAALRMVRGEKIEGLLPNSADLAEAEAASIKTGTATRRDMMGNVLSNGTTQPKRKKPSRRFE